nr:ABC transporter permease [Weissella confusa]
MFRHVLPNVLLPVVTQLGQSLPLLITGAMITETVFSWPGVGAYMMDASVKLDYPVILAVMLLSAFLVVVGNLLADISYALVDPRVRR